MRRSTALVLGVWLLVPAAAVAQGPDQPERARDKRGSRESRPPRDKDKRWRPEEKERLRAQVMEHMRTLRMWRVTDVLKLDEAAAARLYPVFARFDEEIVQQIRARGEAGREMRRQLESTQPDEGELNAAMDRFMAARARRNQLEDERFQALRKVLTSAQAAQLLQVLPDIDEDLRRRVHEVIRKAREEAGLPPHPAGPPPPGPPPPR